MDVTKGDSNIHIQSERDGYRTDIDGLRAIAVTAVVLYHAGVAGLSGGFVGVDIFFVISGYLIGAHIYRDISAGRFSLARFYQRRAKRILPALFGVLLFCYALSWFLLAPTELESFGKYAVSTVFSVSNVLAWHTADYFAPGADQNPLLMTWSLGVEEHFYIFFPLLMLFSVKALKLHGERLRSRLFWIMFFVALVSFAMCIPLTKTHKGVAFYLLPTRAWELSVGVLMAIHEAGRIEDSGGRSLYGGGWGDARGILGLCAILFAVFHYGPAVPFPGIAAAVPVMGAALVLSAPEAWLNRWLFSSKPFRWVGLVSYSWYLWHWPLLSFAHICDDRPVTTREGLFLVAVAFGLASLSYYFIEQPFRSTTLAAKPLLLRYGVACLLVGLPGAVMAANHGFPRNFGSLASQEEEIRSATHPCVGAVKTLEAEGCLPVPDGRPAIALVGDSHANALVWQMGHLAADADMRLYTLTHTTCPPLLEMAPSNGDSTAQRECFSMNDEALHRVASDKTVQTVVLAGFWSAPWITWGGYQREGEVGHISLDENKRNFEYGLDTTIGMLQAAGKRIVLVQDSETLRFDPARRLRAYMIPARGWVARRLGGEQQVPGEAGNAEMYTEQNAEAAEILSKVARRRGVETYDLRNGLCRPSGCTFFSNGVLWYRDDNHLSPEGAAQALREFPSLQKKASD